MLILSLREDQMRIKQLLMGVVASVIAVSSYVEIAVADLKLSLIHI